ncbi:hypothetical protein ACDQ55_14425 [Chitinophaga sp. 30R24]|uniref:hypothetical protein n=1 Tax=Chitinophaga sp. 30R24 TaxID=3248838 RepID=UPI003B919C08
MKKNKVLFTRLIVCGLAAGLFLFNTKVLVQKNFKASDLKLSNLLTNVSADEETSNGSDPKECATEACSVTRTYGIEPYTYQITYTGHYSHCRNATSGTCSSSQCDKSCDAGK